MPRKKLTVASIAIETAPFVKTGGLGDVARSLPLAMRDRGHNPIIILPYFSFVDHKKFKTKPGEKNIKITVDKEHSASYEYYTNSLKGMPVYFVDVNGLFKKNITAYGRKKKSSVRYYLFSLAVIDLLERLSLCPDIIHLHDHHVGLIAYLLKTKFKHSPLAQKAKIVYNIHNLKYQMEAKIEYQPKNHKDTGMTRLPMLSAKGVNSFKTINFAKRALIYSDLIVTVSKQYAKEIQTHEFGFKLDRLLCAIHKKGKLKGILNGIDSDKFNPKTDPYLFQNFGIRNLKKKKRNKTHLQKISKLEIDPEIPILAMISRISTQKGFDLLFEFLPTLATMNLQLVMLGTGQTSLMKTLNKWSHKAENIRAYMLFDLKLASQIYAASDIFLMPSAFEPCGLGQLIALRYGSIPIVHSVGGLKDTVLEYNPKTGEGNGFTFPNYNSTEFLMAIVRALENYKHKDAWHKLIKNAMQADYSWDSSVKKYEKEFYALLK